MYTAENNLHFTRLVNECFTKWFVIKSSPSYVLLAKGLIIITVIFNKQIFLNCGAWVTVKEFVGGSQGARWLILTHFSHLVKGIGSSAVCHVAYFSKGTSVDVQSPVIC